MRKEKERDYLTRAVESFKRQFIIISPRHRIITASHPGIADTDPSAKERSPHCFRALFEQEAPCAGCPAVIVKRTLAPAIAAAQESPAAAGAFSCLAARPLFEGEELDAIVVSDFIPDFPAHEGDAASLLPVAEEEEGPSTEAVIDALPGGVLLTDREGRVTLVNAALKNLLAIEGEIPNGCQIGNCIPDRALSHLIRQISEADPQSSARPHTYEFSPAPGKYLRACVYPCTDPAMEGFGALTTVALAEGNCNAITPEYVAKLSHEIRSPLTTIHEQLDLVLKYMTGKSEAEKEAVVVQAREKTRGLIALLNDLLDLSRIETGSEWMNPEPLRLDGMLKGIIEFMRPTAESRGHRLVTEMPEEPLPVVIADPMAMESVFGNLVTNAINYTPGNGEIVVSAGLERGMVTVAVRDNGVGISHADQQMIFRHFHRARNEKTRYVKGTGLGLAIVKGLVDAHNGAVSVQSAPGQGSVFTVRLPAREAISLP